MNSLKLNLGISLLLFSGVGLAASVDGSFAAKVAADNPTLPPVAIKKAFQYLAAHDDVFKNQEYMAIANFDQPSTEKRLYMINLKTGVTERFLVSHGKNTSDKDDRSVAKYFSNTKNSKKSSLGFYRTLDKNEEVTITNSEGETYKSTGIYPGKHGRSLRLKGVQSTNSNALNREIVIHGASYVSASFIKVKGRLGESWGCPAVDFAVRDKIMDRLEGRALYYIYKTPEATPEVAVTKTKTSATAPAKKSKSESAVSKPTSAKKSEAKSSKHEDKKTTKSSSKDKEKSKAATAPKDSGGKKSRKS